MTDEDAELKDVLIRSLNEAGILPRLQAQLRAAIYLALEKHNYDQKLPPANVFLKNLCSTEDGSIIVSLIAEFLNYANLESTLEVFKHEVGLSNLSLIERPTLHSLLKLDDVAAEGATLVKLISSWRSGAQSSDIYTIGKKKEVAGTSVLTPSRIPTLANRRTSAPLSHASDRSTDEDIRGNGCGDESTSDGLTDNSSRPSTGRSVSTPVDRLQNSKKDKPDFIDPLLQVASGPDTRPSGLDEQSTSRPTMTSDFLVNNLQPNPSPREPEYQDDFESPRSQGSTKTLSSQTDGSGRSRGTPHPVLEKGTNRLGPFDMASADRSNTTTPTGRPVAQSPAQRPDSRSSSPSIIRLYTRFKKPSPSDDASSDVDGEDEISELVKELEYSGEEDTIDQTIDSDESLLLDHVEDVIIPRKSISPSA